MVSWLLLWSASPHPTLLAPNWSTHSKYRTTGQSSQQRLMEAVLVYYLLLPSSSWQVPRGCPQAARRNTRHHPDQQWLTSYMEGGLHPTGMEEYVLHGGRTTFYTEGGPHPTQMEDCYREADSFEAVLLSHFVDAVCRAGAHKCLNVWRNLFSPSTADSRDQIQVVRLGGKSIHLLSYCTSFPQSNK